MQATLICLAVSALVMAFGAVLWSPRLTAVEKFVMCVLMYGTLVCVVSGVYAIVNASKLGLI